MSRVHVMVREVYDNLKKVGKARTFQSMGSQICTSGHPVPIGTLSRDW